MQEPFYSYEEFPENMSEADGMEIIYGKDEVGINCFPDIVYAVKDGIELHVRSMFPRELNENKRYPTIFHIQGSAWLKQNMSCHMGDFSPIVRAGYGVILIEYRFAPDYRFPAQIEDGKSAVRFVMNNLDQFPVDTNNLFLSGDSSGGHTAMMMMTTWDTMECDAEKTTLPRLNGCIDLYGSVNTLTMNDSPSAYDHMSLQSPASNYLGFSPKDNPEESNRRMPFFYINKDTEMPPLLIMHGSKDRTVPFTQSLELYNHVKSMGKDVKFYKVKNADHGGNVFYCSATIETILQFLDAHLR
ncbi:alpha/beta hydrolase fold domain-containing protein [Pseudobutyrivibrio sp.]